jgi:outer membrane lipoprotein-sorting protein
MAGSQRLLSFLTGMGDLTEQFEIVEPSGVEETAEGNVTLKLLPRFENVQWKYLQLTVDPDTFQVVGTTFEGIQGDETEIVYTNIRTDLGLSDALFELEVPEGADVLHYPPREQQP